MPENLNESARAFQQCIQERDRGAAEAILDDDFALLFVYPDRAIIRRERWLDTLPGYVVHSYEVEESIMETYGDYATVFQRARMRATVMEQDRSGLFIITDIWRRRDGVWRLSRRHSTPVSANTMPVSEPLRSRQD